MRIDAHTHAFHPKVAARVLKRLDDHYAIAPVGTGTVDDLKARLGRAGLDRAVVLTAATDPTQVIPANNWAMDLMRHPEFIPFGTMHPDYPDMEGEFARLERAGIRGIKLHSDFQGFALDEERTYRLMEAAGDRFILLFHVGDACPAYQCGSSPDKLAGLRRAFPGPTIIAAHMGGWRHWELALSTLAGQDIWFDTSSTLPFVDPGTLGKLLDAHPAERILFGSDYPLFDPAEQIARLGRDLRLTDSRLGDFLTNARRLFA